MEVSEGESEKGRQSEGVRGEQTSECISEGKRKQVIKQVRTRKRTGASK